MLCHSCGDHRVTPAMIKLRCPLTSYWKLILLQAGPKLGDERKPLWWCQAPDFVKSKEFHIFKPRENEYWGKWCWATAQCFATKALVQPSVGGANLLLKFCRLPVWLGGRPIAHPSSISFH